MRSVNRTSSIRPGAMIGMLLAGLSCVGLFSIVGAPAPVRAEDSSAKGAAAGSTSTASDTDIISFINAQIRQGWKDKGYAASPKATDNEWVRRVYLDVLGRVPTVVEVERFLKDTGDKRAKLLDKLLDSDQYVEEYARNWTTVWTNLLIGRPPARRENGDPVNREGMQQYLRRVFLTNKPYDQMVFELVSATGSTAPGKPEYNGATNFLVGKLQENATEATSKTAKYFLGMQVQCTQCHNHPFNDWKQDQFWSMNAFFRQTKSQRERMGRDVENATLTNEDFRGEGSTPQEAEIYYELRNGTMQVAYPTFVDGTKIDPNGMVSAVDRRKELGQLITKSEFLGKAFANRMWAHFLGYGFTKPVDDMGPHNPASHQELLDRLGQEFAAHGYDVKKMIRWITLSEAYALSSKTTSRNIKDDPTLGEKPMFSHFYTRQMQAEQLYESLQAATEALRNQSYEEQERTKAMWMQQFSLTFGNDEGEEATTFNGTIPQALMMMNGEMIKSATSVQADTFLGKLAASSVSSQDAINLLFMAALARKPSGTEMGTMAALAKTGDTASVYQDIWWALLNSNEFIFVH